MSKNKVNPKPPSGSSNCLSKQGLIPCSLLQGCSFSETKSHARRNKIKIINLHWGFIPGGGATYARYLQDVGNYAPIVMKNLCINAPKWPVDQLGMRVLNATRIDIKGRWDLQWIWKARHFLKRERPNIILVNGFNTSFVAMLSSAGLCIPIFSSWHGDYYPTTFEQKLRKPIFDLILKLTFRHVIKGIVTVSHFSKKALTEKGINPEKITVIHNGIPELAESSPVKLTEMRRELQVPDDALLFGTACRLASEKGLEWFLRTAAKVVQYRPELRFVIWGDGPQKEPLQRLVRDFKVKEFVKIPGYIDDVGKYLKALDVFFLSSSAENFPISLLEAMRAGLPIISTRVGGVPEAIKDGVQGIMIPFGDDDALGKAITQLADNPSYRDALGKAARKRFNEEFTSEKMVRKTAEWLFGAGKNVPQCSISEKER